MGWFFVLVSGVAAFLLFRTGHLVLMGGAMAAAAVIYWSWGRMHSYVAGAAKRRSKNGRDAGAAADREARGVPDWVAALNMLSSLAGLILLVAGIVFLVRGV